MSKTFVEKAGKKLFERHLEQYSPADPLYETYTDKKGKQRRRKRAIPPGLSKRDQKILKSVNRRAHYLDKGFSICGFRFGWTFVIGIVPGAGDVADALLNYLLVVRKAKQAELPGWLVQRMLLNNAVSIGVGAVPIVGDIVLAIYKANSRNAALLEEFLRIRGEEFLKLEAAGKSPEAAAKGELKESKKGKEVAKGVKKSDAEQVKPGAGRSKDEVVPVSTADAAAVAGPSTATSETLTKPPTTKKNKSFTAWFIGNGSDSKTATPAASGEKGRFVEDVGSNLKKATGESSNV